MAILLCWCGVSRAGDAVLFDKAFVHEAPLEARVISAKEEDGIVREEVEFVGCLDRDGKAIRTFGRLYRPAVGKRFPAILWCEGGMSDARPNGIALILAKKGYLTLSCNLPKKEWGSHERFNTQEPANANFIRFAVTYMRGITYLLSRPEADGERVGIGGASYGGVFSTLVSGLDARIDVGMSFFSGGNHHLGTNLPQFNKLESLEQIAVFQQTGDGAHHQRQRGIPFLWGVAANDNWFDFPAVVQTWREAKSPGKRLSIMPLWEHGFPEAFDQQLFDWFDIHLAKTRAPYNLPGKMKLSRQDGKLVAAWDWTGVNRVGQAELVVSYGLALPWHGWKHRLHHRIAAQVDGNTARAIVPVGEKEIEMLIYGNISDENQVITSTDPVVVRAGDFGAAPAAGKLPEPNGCPWGDFEAEAVYIFGRYALLPKLGVIDTATFHGGKQALRVDADMPYRRRQKPLQLKLFNVYARGHKLRLWLKADREAQVTVRVQSFPPKRWDNPAPTAILSAMPRSLMAANHGEAPVFEKVVTCGKEWQEFELDCPFTGRPVDGYFLRVQFPEKSEAVYWIDDIRFTPVWKSGAAGEQ